MTTGRKVTLSLGDTHKSCLFIGERQSIAKAEAVNSEIAHLAERINGLFGMDVLSVHMSMVEHTPGRVPDRVYFDESVDIPTGEAATKRGLDGITRIAIERQRQMTEEGFSLDHDDRWELGELVKAAACYAVWGTNADVIEGGQDAWPWDTPWDKRGNGNALTHLVKAGALIAAEIDRIQRREST